MGGCLTYLSTLYQNERPGEKAVNGCCFLFDLLYIINSVKDQFCCYTQMFRNSSTHRGSRLCNTFSVTSICKDVNMCM